MYRYLFLTILVICIRYEPVYWKLLKVSCQNHSVDKNPFVLVVGCFLINVDLAIFEPYVDLEAGDNQSLKIQVARRGIEPQSSCSASQELNHSATAALRLWP